MENKALQVGENLWSYHGYTIKKKMERFSVYKLGKFIFEARDFSTVLYILDSAKASVGTIKINGKLYEAVVEIGTIGWNANMITIHLPENADIVNWYHAVELKCDLPSYFCLGI